MRAWKASIALRQASAGVIADSTGTCSMNLSTTLIGTQGRVELSE